MVIHQTFTGVHLRLLTPESHSVTVTATVMQEHDQRSSVAGIYRNEPKLAVRDRSPIHYGGLRLLVVGAGEDRLQGEYWTDRGTRGSLDLHFVTRRKALDYDAANAMVQDH